MDEIKKNLFSTGNNKYEKNQFLAHLIFSNPNTYVHTRYNSFYQLDFDSASHVIAEEMIFHSVKIIFAGLLN